jgi:hypothetical protein
MAFSDVLPRRKTEEKCSSTCSFNKRVHLQASFLYALFTLLAGRGGERGGMRAWWSLAS